MMKIFRTPPDENSFRDKDEVLRYWKLQESVKDKSVFIHEGLYFAGNSDTAIQRFIYDNPTKTDFRAWLLDNYTELKELES